MKKRLLWAAIGIIILLALTNPSLGDFKDNGHPDSIKTSNWLIFSIFETSHQDFDNRNFRDEYLGICKNFFQINSDYNPPTYHIKEWK